MTLNLSLSRTNNSVSSKLIMVAALGYLLSYIMDLSPKDNPYRIIFTSLNRFKK